MTCDSTGWVCEDHPTQPWAGISDRGDACACADAVECGCGCTDAARTLRAGFCVWFERDEVGAPP
jgi:hypothetical protein